jgi:D-glycero-D-manno-heptose 1,7-bisphosphate phosphatase
MTRIGLNRGDLQRRCVFLDRDGVLIEDRHLLRTSDELSVLPGVPAALARLRALGFILVVVTNQPVIARGMLTESELNEIHRILTEHCTSQQCTAAGVPPWDAIYYCPHHPQATLERYRIDCGCRKPRDGMLVQAASDLNLDLTRSFLVGDRLSDIAAGASAGCRTVLIKGPMSDQPPIISPDAVALDLRPDFVCDSLLAASQWIAEEA